MIRREGAGMLVEGPLNLETVTPLVESGATMIAAGAEVVDLARTTDVDSSAVALLLEWTRRAAFFGVAVPRSLRTIGTMGN